MKPKSYRGIEHKKCCHTCEHCIILPEKYCCGLDGKIPTGKNPYECFGDFIIWEEESEVWELGNCENYDYSERYKGEQCD